MGAGAGGVLGSETGAAGQKPMNPMTAQRSADLRARMQGAMPTGQTGPGGGQVMGPPGGGMNGMMGQAATGAPPPGPAPGVPMPPPGGWGTAMAGAPPGGSAPMGQAPQQGWLQKALAAQGGVAPAAQMPAERPWAPVQKGTPLEIGGKKPVNQNANQRPGMGFFQQASKGWGRNSSGQRRYMGGSR